MQMKVNYAGCVPKVTRGSRANHKGVRAWSGTSLFKLLIALSFMLLSVNAMQGLGQNGGKPDPNTLNSLFGGGTQGGFASSPARITSATFSRAGNPFGDALQSHVGGGLPAFGDGLTQRQMQSPQNRGGRHTMSLRNGGRGIVSARVRQNAGSNASEGNMIINIDEPRVFKLTMRKNVTAKRLLAHSSYKTREVSIVKDQLGNAAHFVFLENGAAWKKLHLQQVRDVRDNKLKTDKQETKYFTGMTERSNTIALLQFTSTKAKNGGKQNRWLELNEEGLDFLGACQKHSVQFENNWLEKREKERKPIVIYAPQNAYPTITAVKDLKDYYHAAANGRYSPDRIVSVPDFEVTKLRLHMRKSQMFGKTYKRVTVEAMISKSTKNLLWFTIGDKKFHITSVGKPVNNTIKLTTTKHGKKSGKFADRYLDAEDEANKIFIDFCRRYNVPSEDRWLSYEQNNVDILEIPYCDEWATGFYLHALKENKIEEYKYPTKVVQPDIVNRFNAKREAAHQRKTSFDKRFPTPGNESNDGNDIRRRRRLASLTKLLEQCEKNGYAQ